jgi:cell fate (sporulation/competence/biofilm development) regulator YlbF (YheA/YmcA/DUF963 family)
MNLPEDLRKSAELLGQALAACQVVQAYQEERNRVNADPEALALEQELGRRYEELIARRSKGEAVAQEEIGEFNQLRSSVYTHPVIMVREDALSQVKPWFVQVAGMIDRQTGAIFTKLARE